MNNLQDLGAIELTCQDDLTKTKNKFAGRFDRGGGREGARMEGGGVEGEEEEVGAAARYRI